MTALLLAYCETRYWRRTALPCAACEIKACIVLHAGTVRVAQRHTIGAIGDEEGRAIQTRGLVKRLLARRLPAKANAAHSPRKEALAGTRFAGTVRLIAPVQGIGIEG